MAATSAVAWVGYGLAAAAVAGSTYAAVDNSNHAKTDASNDANVAQDNANAAIAAAQKQQQQVLNQQANVTAAAQARVRAISNPDGDTIMKSPLGQVGLPATPTQGNSTTNVNSQAQMPGMVSTPGKSTIGG
jgi:hypothetical protein